jgi:membrane protein YdbS with pleckstrin-like domain
MQNAVIIFLFALVIVFGFIPTVKRKQSREIWVYSILLFICASVLILKLFIKPDMNTISHFLINHIKIK